MTETVSSTSDARIVNNVMRHEYRVLTDAEKVLVGRIKDLGAQFLAVCDEATAERLRSGVSGDIHREIALARTKIEEAVMWAVKGVTK